jgi:Flp pilus assembly protein TadG
MTMRSFPSLTRRPRRRSQRGGAAVEFALLMLPLAALTFGITECGRALYEYNTLAKSVRDAARYQSSATPGSTLAARCVALTGSPVVSGNSCSGTPLLPALTLAQVSACDRVSCPSDHNLQPTGRGVVNLVTVSVTGYPFTSMVPFAMPSISFGTISATMAQAL